MDTATWPDQPRPLAVIAGASSGIGCALAEELGNRGYDLLVTAAAEQPGPAAQRLVAAGAAAEPVRAAKVLTELAKAQGAVQAVRARQWVITGTLTMRRNDDE
jgi:NAD(P)-dependent dehydrogenase (short-subunit alcohol dehydrogenase family)